MLLLGVGINLQKHYCAGELEAVSIVGILHNACCDTDAPQKCCKDEQVRIVLEEDARIQQDVFSWHSTASFFLLFYTQSQTYNTPNWLHVFKPNSSIPPPLGGKLHISIRSLLI